MVNLMSPKELNDLGDQYFYGRGVDKNLELAFTYYKRAADQNNPIGLFNVGKYFLIKNQGKDAVSYLEKAASLDYAKAYILLSDMFYNQRAVKKNKKKAFKYLEKATELKDVESFHLFGLYYLEGIGIARSEERALKYFELSATSNQVEGMFLYGKLLLTGRIIRQDFETAFFYLDKAASLKSVKAIDYLKKLYKEPHPYLRKKSALYREEMWFYYDELLANLDDETALERVARAYYYGNELIKIDFKKALKYYKILHGLDNQEGYLGLGLAYFYATGVEEDFEKARDYLSIAATRGNAKAKNILGDLYRLGKGVPADYQKARDYYLDAAKDNEQDALINLGLLHYRKQIKNASDLLAYQFMTKASEYNNANAIYWLGIFHDKAIGTEKSYALAKRYFERAIALGNIGAKYKLAQLLLEEVIYERMAKRKADRNYLQVKDLLIEYINSPLSQETNIIYSHYLLGELYQNLDFSLYSLKIARYNFEMAAEKGLAKAQVEMFKMLWEKEMDRAIYWLKKATDRELDGEGMFLLAELYEEGKMGFAKDLKKANELYQKSAKLGFQRALVKLTVLK